MNEGFIMRCQSERADNQYKTFKNEQNFFKSIEYSLEQQGYEVFDTVFSAFSKKAKKTGDEALMH